MRRAILPVFGVLAVLLAVWWVVAERDHHPGEPKNADSTVADTTEPVSPADSVDSAEVSREPIEADLTEDEPVEHEGPAWRIEVLRAPHLEPATDAELLVVSATELTAVDPLATLWNAPFASIVAAARTVPLSRETALASIPESDEGLLIAARTAQERAQTLLFGPPSHRPVELILEPTRILVVNTVDGAGSPLAGVPVLFLESRSSPLSSRLPGAEVRERAWSGSDGKARFDVSYADAFVDQRRLHDRRGWFVSAEMPGAQIVTAARVIPEAGGSGPVECTLEMPPVGSLLIEVQDADGTPFLHPAEVRVTTKPRNTFMTVDGQETVTPPELRRTTTHGRVHWSHVATDSELTIGVTTAGFATVFEVVPAVAVGEARRVSVVLDRPLPRIRGRAVQEATSGDGGGAFSGALQLFPARVDQEHPPPWSRGVAHAGDDGAFEFTLEPGPPRALWLGRDRSAERNLRGCDLVARVELPELVVGDEHDLGVVTFRSLPALARGVVQDRAGEPVRGALVTAEGPSGSGIRVATTRTGDDGEFVLVGRSERWGGRLSVQAEGYSALLADGISRKWEGRVEVDQASAGAEAVPEVQIELVRHGTLGGPLAAGSLARSRWFYDLLDVGGLRWRLPSLAYTLELSPYGYRLSGPPGTVTMELELYLASFYYDDDSQEVIADESFVCTIPESDDPEVSGPPLPFVEVWLHEIEVLSHEGEPLDSAWVFDGEQALAMTDRAGRATVAALRPIAPLAVYGDHHRPREIHPTGERTQVQLLAGIPVRVHVDGGDVATVMAAGTTGPHVVLEPIAPGVFEFGAPGPGSYTLHLYSGATVQSELVEVVESDEVQELSVQGG